MVNAWIATTQKNPTHCFWLSKLEWFTESHLDQRMLNHLWFITLFTHPLTDVRGLPIMSKLPSMYYSFSMTHNSIYHSIVAPGNLWYTTRFVPVVFLPFGFPLIISSTNSAPRIWDAIDIVKYIFNLPVIMNISSENVVNWTCMWYWTTHHGSSSRYPYGNLPMCNHISLDWILLIWH